jgi:hypothetical protein
MNKFIDWLYFCFGKPQVEAVLEVLRFVVLFVISWIITETLKQINLVPSFLTVKIWVFSYLLPVRDMLTILLTMTGRFIDKMLFEKRKMQTGTGKGILPF